MRFIHPVLRFCFRFDTVPFYVIPGSSSNFNFILFLFIFYYPPRQQPLLFHVVSKKLYKIPPDFFIVQPKIGNQPHYIASPQRYSTALSPWKLRLITACGFWPSSPNAMPCLPWLLSFSSWPQFI